MITQFERELLKDGYFGPGVRVRLFGFKSVCVISTTMVPCFFGPLPGLLDCINHSQFTSENEFFNTFFHLQSLEAVTPCN